MVPISVRCVTVLCWFAITAPAHGGSAVTWESVRHAGSASPVERVVFTGSLTGWMVQRDGVVQISADGGRSWTIRARMPGPARSLAADPGLVAVSGDGVVWSSTTGGLGWNTSPLGGGGSLNAVTIGPDDSLWAAGMGSEVHVSRDRGATWRSAGGRLGHLFAVAAGPDGVVLAGGLRGLWESRDAGVHWSYVNLARRPEVVGSPRPVITDLHVAPDGVWITGRLDDAAMLWRATWADPTGAALVHDEDDYRYLRVLRGRGDTLWVSGPGGFVARSDDRGVVWSQVPPGIPGEVRVLAMRPDGVVFAAGDGGRVFSRPDSATASEAAGRPRAVSAPVPCTTCRGGGAGRQNPAVPAQAGADRGAD